MPVEHVSSLSEFENIKRNSGNLLVVVDFHATWCGPCHAIAPFYEQLADRYARRARFLKVDVDEAQEIAQACGISAMPTFHFYVKGSAMAQVQGADRTALESNVERYAPSAASISFSGSGHTLGSSSSGPLKIDWNAGLSKDGPGDAAKARREAMAQAAAQRAATSAPSQPAAADAAMDEGTASDAPAAATDAPTPDVNGNEAETANENDPRLKVDEALLRQLEEMGFPKIRAQKGLIFTGNKSLEPAMEWCFSHADDPDIDEPLSLVTEDGTPKVQLSAEERKKKADEALKKARARRLEQEKKDEIQREKDRIRSGKEIASARRTIEDQERRRAVEQKRKEKLAAIAEKKRVRELLEADKARRREKFNMGKASSATPSQSAQPAALAPAAPPAPHTAGKIQLRLQDGTRLEQSFEPDQVLRDVAAFIATSRPEFANKTFGFSQQYPRRVFTEADYEATLQDLNLLPRGALNVTFK